MNRPTLSALLLAIAANALVAKPLIAEEPTQKAMSARVDELLEAKMSEMGIQPAGPCDDAAFLRRTHLDLTGSPPSGRDVIDFVESDDENKRAALVDRLLNAPSSAAHFSQTWASWLLPEDLDVNPIVLQQNGLQSWLRDRFLENLRYDRLVSDLLISTGSVDRGPTAFFTALEIKPEKIAAKTARIFMGVQLDCAECHDHPFDDWTQQDFWGYAAYFAQISSGTEQAIQPGANIQDIATGDVMLPDTEDVVAPKPLVTTGFSGIASGTRRQQLTLWLTARENPFLARATVNRVWAMLFGRGLIEPIDDMRSLDIASHPELLGELSDYFADTGYDLRNLFSTLTKTKAYRRATGHSQADVPPTSYAVMATKPLTEVQLANSLRQVTRQVDSNTQQATPTFPRVSLSQQLGKLRGEAGIAKLGIVNALVTLNGGTVDAFSRETSSRLIKALDAPFMNQRKQVEWLFITTLCRTPTQSELAGMLKLIESQRAPGVPVALASEQSETEDDNSTTQAEEEPMLWQSDLLWALLNSSEFAMTP